jgi:hypothetical protein
MRTEQQVTKTNLAAVDIVAEEDIAAEEDILVAEEDSLVEALHDNSLETKQLVKFSLTVACFLFSRQKKKRNKKNKPCCGG